MDIHAAHCLQHPMFLLYACSYWFLNFYTGQIVHNTGCSIQKENDAVGNDAGDCAFDIHCALNAHKSLDKICNEEFFEKTEKESPMHTFRSDPFAIIRDTNEVHLSLSLLFFASNTLPSTKV